MARVAAMGGRAVDVDIAPLLAAAELLYQGPWVAERTAAVEPLLRTRPAAIHPVVRGILQGGWSISAVEAFKADYQLRVYQRAAERLWEAVDVLLLADHGDHLSRRRSYGRALALNSNLGRYTNFVNLLDMSAIAVPAGFRDNATGFGVTLIGPAWADRRSWSWPAATRRSARRLETPPLDVEHGAPRRA